MFALYFTVTAAIMMSMFFRVQMLRLLLSIVRSTLPSSWTCTQACPVQLSSFFSFISFPPHSPWNARKQGLVVKIQQWIGEICAQPMAFFAKNDDLATLNKAVLYVRGNEVRPRPAPLCSSLRF